MSITPFSLFDTFSRFLALNFQKLSPATSLPSSVFSRRPPMYMIRPMVRSRFMRIGGRKKLESDIYVLNENWRPFSMTVPKRNRALGEFALRITVYDLTGCPKDRWRKSSLSAAVSSSTPSMKA